ncbi:MAG TPA: FHA domain-containing protein [Kofleriaceae bacterium]|nr:FHA domain-containing protein [Kofleriaceae bacterium]
MLRVEVSEAGQAALPAVDVDDAVVVIGSATNARIRLPANAAEREHVRVEGKRWRAVGAVKVDGAPRDGGDIGDGVTLEVAGYRVRLMPAPAGAQAAPVQRTESLARELMRNLLGSAGQPTLEIERGARAGAKRALQPPESTLVIGRGDEANWIIDDKDLSRTHAEIRRGWDGTRIVDLESKNGTKVDGDPVGAGGMALRDGCLVELGPVVMRFRDPAEKHLQGDAPAFRPLLADAPPLKPAPAPSVAVPRGNPVIFYGALAIMALALAGLVWILAS